MDSLDEIPTPPAVPGLAGRSLEPADVPAILALAAACLAVDGGLPLNATDAREYYLPACPGASIGAFQIDGPLVASAAVRPTHTMLEYQATIVGQVHPTYRRRGFGAFLLKWSIAQAGRLLAICPADRPHVLQITTESLTEAGERFLERHGFAQQSAAYVMRRDLKTPLPDIPLPSGIRFAAWVPALASEFYAVFQAAYREFPFLPDQNLGEWVAWLGPDEDDFRPQMSLLAHCEDLPVGAIVCADRWISGIGVRPEWRERGIGSALMLEALRRFQAAGDDHVLLCVNVSNPRAARVHTRLGFVRVGRRAHYVRALGHPATLPP
jgi:mycothiol synthase